MTICVEVSRRLTERGGRWTCFAGASETVLGSRGCPANALASRAKRRKIQGIDMRDGKGTKNSV